MRKQNKGPIVNNLPHMAARVALLAVAALILSSQSVPREQPGVLPDGSFLLHSGWRIKPAGQQVKLDTLPMSSVLSRDGKFLIVLNGGYNPPSLHVMDVSSGKVINTVPVPDAWLGLVLTPDGKTLYVGGGSQASIFEFAVRRRRQFENRAHVPASRKSQANLSRFHRRCGDLTRWPPAVRSRSFS